METLKATESQAATLSSEAVELMNQLYVLRVAPEYATDEMLLNLRQQFAQGEAVELDDMKKRFNPTIEVTTISGVKTYIITPQLIKAENQDKIILYIHGGGYIMGSATDRTGMLMANELGYKTYSVDYQLAPEAKYPVALNECVAVYKHLVSAYDPSKIVCVSTSAGSTHMLAMLVKAKELNLPMINSVALLSPSVDLTNRGDSVVSNENRDVLDWENQADVLYMKPFVGNANPEEGLVSPIYATYTSDFPPTTIVTGTRDMFLSGSTRLFWKLREAGIKTELLVLEGMWHAFTNFPDLPEAIQARKATQDFVRECLGKQATKAAPDTQANIDVVKRFTEDVVNNQKFDLVDDFWTKDMQWHGGSMGEINGIEAYKKFLTASVDGAFTGMHLEVQDVVAQDDKVLLYFSNSGTNVGEFLGNQGTGKFAKWNGMSIYRVEDGKIAEAWYAEDLLMMFLQLGFIKL